MDYVVAIPSTERYDTINKRTLRFLRKHKIPRERVYIFVPPNQVQKYKVTLYNYLGYNIVSAKDGLQAQRNFISEYFEENQLILEMDDDVTIVKQMYQSKNGYNQLKNLECLESLILDTYMLFLEKGLTCAGIYPVCNKVFMKNTTSTHLCHLIGSFRIFLNCKICESRMFHLLEDYEVSLKYFLKDKGLIRYNDIAIISEYMSPTYYERSLAEKKFEIMCFTEKYSDYCYTKKKPNNIIDLQFKKKISF